MKGAWNSGAISRTPPPRVLFGRAGEPRIPTCIGGSKREGQWRREFAAGGTVHGQRVAGLPIHGPTNSDVEVGINKVFAAFALNKIVLFEDLHGVLDEIGSYSRELDDMGEPTETIDGKENYHHLDAMRYALQYINVDKPQAKMNKTPWVKGTGLSNL